MRAMVRASRMTWSSPMTSGAREVRLATMLFKPAALRADLTPDYVCFEIPNDFVVGHGLDYDEFGRVYKDIYRLKV